MDCHNTHPHALLTGTGPASHDNAIGCERCHGPGANHQLAVSARSADLAIGRPSLASGPSIVALCGECHSPRSKDQKLSPGSPASVRFPAPSCPGAGVIPKAKVRWTAPPAMIPTRTPRSRRAGTESRCLECHASSRSSSNRSAGPPAGNEPRGQTSCPVQPENGCIACHMPKIKTPVSHTHFTDHFIRVHRETTGRLAGRGAARTRRFPYSPFSIPFSVHQRIAPGTTPSGPPYARGEQGRVAYARPTFHLPSLASRRNHQKRERCP